MITYQVSCSKFTVMVSTKGSYGVIVNAAPIVRKFLGQPFLINWASRFSPVHVTRLKK